MAVIDIRAATAEAFADAQHAFDGGGDGRSCQCQWWLLTNAKWTATSADDRAGMLRDELAAFGPAPALLACVDDEAVGWVRVGPRIGQPRLARTKDLKAGSVQAWDDPSVWAVTCFVVRKEHRGEGLTAVLLDAAIAHARAHGARVVEGYPLDTTVTAWRPNQLYRGILSVFLAAGFHEVARPKPDRAVVALDL